MPIATTPPCSHPPLPIHTVGVHGAPFGTMYRPYATVQAQVDAAGHVTAAEIDDSSGSSDYDAAAVTAMKSWTFMPASDGCKPIAGSAEYVVGYYEKLDFADPCKHDATAVTPVIPDFPDSARAVGHAKIDIAVGLDPVGRVTYARILNPSGNVALDTVSKQAALHSNFFPKVQSCVPQLSQYIYSVTFY
jgi:TonB family protein